MPFFFATTALAAGSNYVVMKSNHWSTKAWWWALSPYNSFLLVDKYLRIVLDEKIGPSGVYRIGRRLKGDNLETLSLVLCGTN